ncbi:MAG: peptidylprolyl isomerase [Burkholderiaceae bacterium]|nr:peptidylprolyl isomerase [Burkholderiaceae bacterium]
MVNRPVAGDDGPASRHSDDARVARVNGRALHRPGEALDGETLRQRAGTELLRQAAQRAGLLAAEDPPCDDGVPSEAAVLAIETLLERELRVPEPSEEACRRLHAQHPERYGSGERVRARHVLFAVTPGVDVAALLAHAEPLLLQLRSCQPGAEADEAFSAAARRYSNCPSSEHGGDLGWLRREDCAPEFAGEIFGHPGIGVLSQLVRSRFGLHIVEVLGRDAGEAPAFDEVRDAVEAALRRHSWITALRQYVRVLAGDAVLEGVDLDAADSPLVQ